MRNLRILVVTLICFLFGVVPALAKGDTLTLAMPMEARILDPHLTAMSGCQSVNRQMFESLVGFDKDGNVIPLLAERWEALPDGKSWKFYLKKGIKFHNGDEMTADDVVFTFKRVRSPETAAIHGLSMYIDPEGAEKVDDYTVILRTTVPQPAIFLASMNHPWTSIVSKKAILEAGKDSGTKPVGTGKFKFDSWVKGDRITLLRHDDYHGEKAKLKKMVIRTLVESSTRTIELESGGIDLAMDPPSVDIKRLQSDPNLKVFMLPGQRQYLLGFDVNQPPYDDPRVREAFSLALDREGIVKVVFRGYAAPSRGLFSEAVKYNKYEQTPPIKRDLERAKQLLKEAGFPKGFEKCELLTSDRTDYLNIATVIQENLRSIGLEVPIRVYEYGTYVDVMRQPKRQPVVHNWYGGAPALDPFFFTTMFWHSSAAGQLNLTYFRDAEVDALLDKGASLPDGPEREAAYGEIWDRVNAAVPAAFLATPSNNFAAIKELEGIHYTPSLINYFGDAYFSDAK